MPKRGYKTCRECGKHADDVGVLSHTRLCAECAERILTENMDQIRAGSGPRAAHRIRRTIMAAHRQLLAMPVGTLDDSDPSA